MSPFFCQPISLQYLSEAQAKARILLTLERGGVPQYVKRKQRRTTQQFSRYGRALHETPTIRHPTRYYRASDNTITIISGKRTYRIEIFLNEVSAYYQKGAQEIGETEQVVQMALKELARAEENAAPKEQGAASAESTARLPRVIRATALAFMKMEDPDLTLNDAAKQLSTDDVYIQLHTKLFGNQPEGITADTVKKDMKVVFNKSWTGLGET